MKELQGYYSSNCSEFECTVLASSIVSNQILIRHNDTGDIGWCSDDLVEWNDDLAF